MANVPPSPAERPERPIPVSELNRLARQTLEARFPLLWVSGEISNLTWAASGHLYFSLKDAQAQVRCVMFRSRAQTTGFRPENGQRVEARVLVSLYEPRGDFQLNVEVLRRAGTGNLYEEFLRRKVRLEQEGLFASEVKRPLPTFPRRIGIVTSPQAAALRDVVTTLGRRAPHVALILYPTPVQGEDAGARIAAALGKAARRDECDLLLLCRGGGSLEDLWSFNDEAVVRAIRACPMPVISGVGHETDFTLADFAADLRAPTPTAAAELACPSRDAWREQLTGLARQIARQTRRQVQDRGQLLDLLERRLRHPAERLRQAAASVEQLRARLQRAGPEHLRLRQHRLALLEGRLNSRRPALESHTARLQQLAERLAACWRQGQEQRGWRLQNLTDQLRHLDPRAVLERGYSIVTTADGRILRDAAATELNAKITVNLAKGRVAARVEQIDSSPGSSLVPPSCGD